VFDKVNHNKLIFKTTENHHAGSTFMLAPLLFPGPHTFNCRIATAHTHSIAATKSWLCTTW